MPPLLRALLALALLASAGQAQIFAVELADAKAERKFRDYVVEYRGKKVIVGEIRAGVTWDDQKRQVTYSQNGTNSFFVADPDDPGEDAYYFKNDKKLPSSKKNTVNVQGPQIARIYALMPNQTLSGLAQEYRIRAAQLEEFRDDRDAQEKGSAAWAARHVRLVTAMERLQLWLASTAFPKAAEDLGREVEREDKKVRDDAVRARGRRALDSIRELEVPARLAELSQEISGGAHGFRAMESEHLRIYYVDDIPDEAVRGAMELGEEIIEGFRAEFVDPWLAEDYLDHVPDGVFQEFFFAPPALDAWERYTNGFWGIDWQRNREVRLAMKGGASVGGRERAFRSYWKNDQLDLEGIVCHRLGHSLASVHYGEGSRHLQQDWLEEALGYYLSFEHLGRNTVTCKAFQDPARPGYKKRDVELKIEGDKTVSTGRRDVYNEVALESGRPIDQLALRDLFEMDDADLAKSWSFYDYVCRKEGEPGQRWLRAAGRFAGQRSSFIAKWRERATEVLGVDPGSAFRDLEERWRAYAGGEQDTSEGPGRGR